MNRRKDKLPQEKMAAGNKIPATDLDQFLNELDNELSPSTLRQSKAVPDEKKIPAIENKTVFQKKGPVNSEILPEGKIKLELKTPFEWLLISLMVFFGFAFLIILLQENSPFQFYYISGGAFILTFLFFLMTDNYYILDQNNEKIFASMNFFGLSFEGKHIPFDDIIAVTTTAEEFRNKYNRYWVYTTVLISKKGKIFPMSDSKKRDEGYDFCNKRAELMAKEAGIQFIPGKYHMEVFAEKGEDGEITVKHRSPDFLTRYMVELVAGGLLLLLILLQQLFPDIFDFFK